MKSRVRVWDGAVRASHWLLVLLIGAAYLTEEFDAMDWHQRIGLTVLGLIVFRLVWGLVGSRHARFTDFLRGPATVRAYLRGAWRGLGHNPLGGWSVLLLLLMPLGMVATGLFANDDVVFKGVLADWVDKDVSDRLTGLHHLGFDLLLGLIALHLGAIAYHRLFRGEHLVKPMLTGWKEIEAGTDDDAPGAERYRGGPFALILALTIAGLTVWGVLAMEPPPPPPIPAESLPDW
jgi:cytochrome b